MKLNEFGPLVAMAARAGGAAIGSKVADKLMGENTDAWDMMDGEEKAKLRAKFYADRKAKEEAEKKRGAVDEAGEELDAIDDEEGADEWSNGEDDSAKTVYDVIDPDDEEEFVEPTHDKEMGDARIGGAPEDVSGLIGEIDYLQNLGMSMSDRHYNTDMLINMKPAMIKRIHSKVKGVAEAVHENDDEEEFDDEGDDEGGHHDIRRGRHGTERQEYLQDSEEEFDDEGDDEGGHHDIRRGRHGTERQEYLQDSVYVNGSNFTTEDWDKIANYRESLVDDDLMEPEEAMEVAVDFLGYDLEEVEDFLASEEWLGEADGEEELDDEPEDNGTGIVAVPDADEVETVPSYDKDMGVARTGGASMDVSDMIGKIAYLQDMGMSMANGVYDTDKLMMMKPEMIERIYHKVLGETKAPNSGMYFSSLKESKAKTAPKKINEGADADVVKALKALFD